MLRVVGYHGVMNVMEKINPAHVRSRNANKAPASPPYRSVMTPTVKASPAILFTCLVVLTILKLCGTVWLRNSVSDRSPTCPTALVGNDDPRQWDIGGERKAARVLMSSEESVHYQLHADLEWGALVPANGTIYLGPERHPFTISMFHQLRCIDTIRTELFSTRGLDTPPPPSELSRHCFNYLRQMALCRADTTLVQVLNPDDPHPFPDVAVCNDWEHVYTEVRRNQEHHREASGEE
ncbi:hypothetical protein EDB89DRAFT_560869 [Lactarius sanguifluus]|nr:hypothetical protein EDB89DRAFT_880332 [Lactarius sanguifluus]KAH9163295.1 hypothetical protein EDB89DRAFT_560869 [Lactarius sanguifluus]